MSVSSFTKKLAAENARRNLDEHRAVIDAILDRCFKQQRDLILDQARRKAAICSRRAGKTYSIAAYLFYVALTKPGSNSYYLALTKHQCRTNVWPYLKQFAHEHELSCKFHETYMQVTLPNGSQISMHGAESREEIEKLRGGANGLDLVVIDECKSFKSSVLTELIHAILEPALSDNRGSLVMIGTPGHVIDDDNPFYAATRNENPESVAQRDRYWSTHSWHTSDNVAKPWIWEEIKARHEARVAAGKTTDNNPNHLREDLGLWAPNNDLLVYKLNPDCLWDADGDGPFGLPDKDVEWKYLLGVDLGFRDATAFTVFAYSDNHPNLYHIGQYKQEGLTYDGIKKAVAKYTELYGSFDAMVVDTGGLGKTIQESLVEDGFPFIPADKRDKLDYIDLFNNEMIAGRVKILRDSYLEAEMRLLQFDPDSARLKEDDSFDNHACDSALYIHRWAYHNLWEPAEKPVLHGSDEYYEELEAAALERAVSRRQQRDSLDAVRTDLLLDLDLWN